MTPSEVAGVNERALLSPRPVYDGMGIPSRTTDRPLPARGAGPTIVVEGRRRALAAGLYFAIVIALVVLLLGLSALLGERHRERATGLPYQSGIVSTGLARLRFGASFYLVAVFFVIFDLEAAFIFSWAVALREIGWTGYVEGVVFIGVLLAALVYLWRVGGLDLRHAAQTCLMTRVSTCAGR